MVTRRCRMDCRIKSGNDDVRKRSRDATASESCQTLSQEKRCFPKKGKAERRKAHCPTMSAPTDKSAKLICARRAHCFFQRAHLSALTLAALATGYYPDGSAPEPGFPRRPLTGVSPVSPTERKNMPRLSTLRADRSLCRSTGDLKPPGNGVDEPLRAGTASRSSSIRRHLLTSLNNERGSAVYCHRHSKVKTLRIS